MTQLWVGLITSNWNSPLGQGLVMEAAELSGMSQPSALLPTWTARENSSGWAGSVLAHAQISMKSLLNKLLGAGGGEFHLSPSSQTDAAALSVFFSAQCDMLQV